MKIQFKINTESENENVSNALSNLLNPLNKLKIFTKNGNVSVMSRELARISSPLVNNILKDVPCCTSTMIFIPDVSKASVDHVINILGTGKTYFNCSSLKQIQEEVKITATMLQIDFSNIKCVGESESRDYLADVDYSSNNKYNLKEDTTEYFEYDAEPFICLKKEYIDKSIKTEPIDTLKEISVDSSKKPQQSGTVKNDLENFYKSEEIDPKKMEKQDISFSANICDCTDNSDPSPPHSKDDTEPAIEISKVVSGKELRRSSRLTNSVSSILDASCFLRPADLRKSDNVDHNSIVYTEAVQGVQKEKEEKVSSLSHCNNCKICMTESNRKSMYDENSVDTVGDDVRGDMKVDYLYVSEQSLRDDQTEGVVHDHKSTDIEDTNGNVFVDNLDVLKNLVSIKSEECLRDDSGQIDFENANLEIVVKVEDQLKVEDPVFRLNQDEQTRQFEEKDIILTSQEESVTTIKTVAKHIQVRIPKLKHADSQDECFDDLCIENEDTQDKLLKQSTSHTSLKKKCPHCEKKMIIGDLSKHIRIVHNKETVQSPYCDKTRYSSLKRHISSAHKQNPLLQKKCPHCEKEMIARNLSTHIRTVHDKETAQCPHCEKMMNPGSISMHIRIVHNKETVQCPHCDKTLGCSSLKRHISYIHKQNPLPQKKCPHCEKKMTAGNISKHIRKVHNKETAQCPLCDKRIAGHGLSKHIRQVHNKKKKNT